MAKDLADNLEHIAGEQSINQRTELKSMWAQCQGMAEHFAESYLVGEGDAGKLGGEYLDFGFCESELG
jgi:hypothetical protein